MISIAKGDGNLDKESSERGVEHDFGVPMSEADSRVLERNVSAGDDRDVSGVGEGSDVEESRVSEVKVEKSPSFVQFDRENEAFGGRRDDFDVNERKPDVEGDAKGEVYKSLLSEFDDFVANEKHGAMEGESRALSYGFEVGDLVWGKVKSHPWWPGHIFNEAFASSSVRRTRRDGYVLVAFFGDSSYGWFDPAELIPFDPHFAEKSQQTSSRNFVRAVEEAMDEACRRQGLGLVCRCRNRYNFRPTDVQGYVEVDVPDYEPRGVYSEIQIKKARDAFQPCEALSFVKQMAFAPQECNQSSVEFMKNRATVIALRKAVFEEFDETYAQAFGSHSKRPANDPAKVSNQPVKQPARAPLSGPLVIAETLGEGKPLKKPVKVKDPSKKDRYLIKRRDESVDSQALQVVQKQPSPSAPATPDEISSEVITGEFVLQKRTSTSASVQHDACSEFSGSGEVSLAKEEISDKSPKHAQTTPGTILGVFSNKDNNVMSEIGNQLGINISPKGVPLGVADGVSQSLQQENDVKAEQSAKLTKSDEGSKLTENLPAMPEGQVASDKIQDVSPAPVGVVGDAGVKKVKVKKRPLGDSPNENSIIKKKKKVQPDAEVNPDKQKKKLAIKTGGSELEVSNLLSNLHSFAVHPFVERRLPVSMKFFLRFRSFYYQKSPSYHQKNTLSSSESTEVHAKSSSSAAATENSPAETPAKPMKPVARIVDPAKGERKRLPSDRQEENAAKRLKKITQLKSLAAEKKALQRPETQRAEMKEPASAAPTKSVKPTSVKKPVPQARVVQPTMLIMKFPPQTTLPSAAELKAKFARFGAIDQSAIRVFWATFTCRVVFRYKGDALAAHKYAANNSLFNDLNVKYFIKEVGAPATEGAETDKGRGDGTQTPIESRAKEPTIERPPMVHQPVLQSNIQPKSILKKPAGEETSGANNGRGTARVKFVLGGEETSRNFNSSASFADGGQPSSVAMDFNSKNFQKVITPASSTSAPLLPLPPQFAKAAINNLHNAHNHVEVAPRIMPKINSEPPAVATPSIDISHQMLSLLTRCNDVVTSVAGLLGYVPYHPL